MVTKKTVGHWNVKVSDARFRVPKEYVDLAGRHLENTIFRGRGEDTWPKKTFGVRSLFVSLKCSIGDNFRLISIDPTPVGMGIAADLNPVFNETLIRVREKWPEFKLLADPGNEGDDIAWLATIRPEDAKDDQSLLLVRTDKMGQAAQFSDRLIAPLRTRFDSHYGVILNLWEEVRWSQAGAFNWKEGFVLRGKQSKILEIWLPGRNKPNRKGLGGISTRTRINRILTEQGTMYYQRFVEPMSVCLEDQGQTRQPMIYKLFFLYDVSIRKHIYAGGLWESLPSLKIHGTPETIFGVLE